LQHFIVLSIAFRITHNRNHNQIRRNFPLLYSIQINKSEIKTANCLQFHFLHILFCHKLCLETRHHFYSADVPLKKRKINFPLLEGWPIAAAANRSLQIRQNSYTREKVKITENK
jgi:hypothetical protein